MTTKQSTRNKFPLIKVDKRLNELANKELFPEKLEKANRILNSTELPASLKRTLDKPIRAKARKTANTGPV